MRRQVAGFSPPPSLVPPQKEPEKPRLCHPVSSVRGFSIIDPPPSGPDQFPRLRMMARPPRSGSQLPSSGEQLSERRRQIGGGPLVTHQKSARRSERPRKNSEQLLIRELLAVCL